MNEKKKAAVGRRELVSALGTALGTLALAGCGTEAEAVALQDATRATDAATIGSSVGWADTVAGPSPNLRDVLGSDATASSRAVIVVGGYAAPGDGGGGTFFWDSTAKAGDDDGGVVIVPKNSTAGAWRRIVDGAINVQWFGAKGDGATQNQQVPIQKAINFAAKGTVSQTNGNTVFIPPGTYLLHAPANGAALWINTRNVRLVGSGGCFFNTTLMVSADGTGSTLGSGIVIDGPVTPGIPNDKVYGLGAQIENLTVQGASLGTPLDGIVMHTSYVSIIDCQVVNFVRFGILIEGGLPGEGMLSPLTQGPAGSYFVTDNWRLQNVFLQLAGMNATPAGDPAAGAGVHVHGSNSQGGLALSLSAMQCNVGFVDNSLGGNTWIGCYVQNSNLGIYNGSVSASTFIGCNVEAQTEAQLSKFRPGLLSVGVGGGIASTFPQAIGGGQARLHFNCTNPTDGATYAGAFPGEYGTMIDLARQGNGSKDLSAFLLWYGRGPAEAPPLPTDPQQSSFPYPYGQGSWMFRHQTNYAWNLDPGGVAFGWTDIANPRGAGLPMMLAPIMNTLRRWSMKQAVVLAPGANVVYCNSKPAGGDAGGFAFADPANFFWPHAQTRVSTDIEFGTLADMNAADVRVAGTTFVGEVSGTRNIAAKIVNSGAAPVTVTLVWHFEAFVTNYDGLW